MILQMIIAIQRDAAFAAATPDAAAMRPLLAVDDYS